MDYNRFERITGHNELGAQTATIYKELGKIRTATTRMIHIIDLNHIEATRNKLRFHIEQDLKLSSHYK